MAGTFTEKPARNCLAECAAESMEWAPAIVPLASTVLFTHASVLTSHAFDTSKGKDGTWIPITGSESRQGSPGAPALGTTHDLADGTIDIVEPWTQPEASGAQSATKLQPQRAKSTEMGFSAAMRRLDRLIELESAESSPSAPKAAPQQPRPAVFATRDRLARPEAVSGRAMMSKNVFERVAPSRAAAAAPGTVIESASSSSSGTTGSQQGARRVSRFRQQREQARLDKRA
jgi:hypothetical protein